MTQSGSFVSTGVILLCLFYVLTFLCINGDEVVPNVVFAIVLALPIIWLSVVDLNRQIIPDFATALIFAVGLVWNAFTTDISLWISVFAGAGICALFWVFGEWYFHQHKTEALGFGDAKLFGAGVVVVGFGSLPELIILASLGGILFHTVGRVLRPAASPSGIPFGPFIGYSIFIVALMDPIFF